jgi:hypothetical protein
MSNLWWGLALIGLYNLDAERPTLMTRAFCYAAAFLMVLAVVINCL